MLQLLKNKLNQLSDFIQASDPLRKKMNTVSAAVALRHTEAELSGRQS